MKVILASPRGYCAGVIRAIEIVERALLIYGPPVFIKHALVHNTTVVRSLEARGAVTVESPDEAPVGAVIVFSAHGSPPEDYEEARLREQTIIDATCPLVTRVHNEAKKYHKEGRTLLYIGHSGHVEPRGALGWAPMELVDDRHPQELEAALSRVHGPLVVLTQTTLGLEDTRSTLQRIAEKFPKAILKMDICFAVTNRQVAVSQLASRVDLVLVVGSAQSSNASRMVEVARDRGCPAYLIEGPQSIDPNWLAGVSTLGLTSGASTPEELVLQVVDFLKPDEVTTLEAVREDIRFILPRDLAL